MSTPRSVADLVSMLAADPGRPRITWYAGGGERVELSGKVLDNWVAKTTNLLVEDLDAEPGLRVLLDLPAHWKQVVWALSVWRAGATVVLDSQASNPGADDDDFPDVVVTSQPDAWTQVPRDTTVVAVALPSLARGWDGTLPEGVMDGVAEVPLFGDVLGWAEDPEPDDTAVEEEDGETRDFAELLNYAVTFADGREMDNLPLRMLVPGNSPQALFSVVGILARGGSAVLVEAAEAAELASDGVRRERLIETERITL